MLFDNDLIILQQVRNKVLSPEFNWENTYITTLDSFFEKYTLHDSYLYAVWSDLGNEITFVFKIDTFWNKEIKEPNSVVANWPFLMIRFSSVFRIKWDMVQGEIYDTVLETETRKLSENEKNTEIPFYERCINTFEEHILSKTDLYKTKFECITGDIQIIHSKLVHILCIGVDGKVLKVP